MIYRKVKTNLSRTLSSIEQDKATSDDYVKCILADPQIAAYIVQALVPEFKDMEAEKIIPCIGEPTVMLRFPERLGVKIQNVNNESVDEDDGKIIYDIKFPLYYNGKRRDVKSLSGGEAFKAALSLALGLSDVIQSYSGGIVVDTMFIDEGFGSLDDVSRDQAIRVLNDLADKDRLIGIISHVSELKQEIEDQLLVNKDENGSHVKWQIS